MSFCGYPSGFLPSLLERYVLVCIVDASVEMARGVWGEVHDECGETVRVQVARVACDGTRWYKMSEVRVEMMAQVTWDVLV